MLSLVRLLTATLYLGPWRGLAIRFYRRFLPNAPLVPSQRSLFAGLNPAEVVSRLQQRGYAMGAGLADEQIEQILGFCDQRRAQRYFDPHVECEAIRDIAYDPKILEVVKGYIGAEPILYSTQLYWTPAHTTRLTPNPPPEKPFFHFDTGDFRSLIVFAYLTDVDQDSGPHVLIEGTHNHKTASQMLTRALSNEEAQKKYRDKIKTITGRKGTLFFEELTCWHKHSHGKKPRLMLAVFYSLQRRPLSVIQPKGETACPTGSTTQAKVASSSAK